MAQHITADNNLARHWATHKWACEQSLTPHLTHWYRPIIPKVCYSEDPLLELGLGQGLGIRVIIIIFIIKSERHDNVIV